MTDGLPVRLTETIVAGRPAWRHEASGVVFRLIPGGEFERGFSGAELAAIKTLVEEDELEWDDEEDRSLPVRTVTVEPFLLAWHPLTLSQAAHFLPDVDLFCQENKPRDTAIIVYRPQALEPLLAALPFRLPSEAEWEYAARAVTTTLWYQGDRLPDESTELLRVFGDEATNRRFENPFGLAAMGCVTEMCADTYRPGYEHAPTDGTPYLGDGPRVLRGGAADVSSWQGCGEEALMFSAFRWQLSVDTYTKLIATGIRPALDWSPEIQRLAENRRGSRLLENAPSRPVRALSGSSRVLLGHAFDVSSALLEQPSQVRGQHKPGHHRPNRPNGAPTVMRSVIRVPTSRRPWNRCS